MKIVIVGGGPGGLYFALLMKKRYPDYDVAVYERNRADDTFGFGVVFSDETLDNLMDYDAPSYQAITREFSYWDEIDFHFHGEVVRSTGHGFCGTERRTLLLVLHARCRELGVKLHFSHEIADLEEFKDADLIVAADGVNSFIRERYKEHFQPEIELRRNHFIWLGTSAPAPAFSFHFTTNEFGIWDLCTYQYKQNMCTWVIEAPDTTWAKAEPVSGQWSEQETIAYLEDMWAHLLKGHKLVGNRSYWRRFPVIRNKNWHYKNIVLLGDALHTAHFSIGSGTKLAMEDAISLARHVTATADLDGALGAYQMERHIEVLKLQSAARNRMEWFENVARYVHLPPEQFAYSLLTGSQRIGHENLKLRDPLFVESYERWLASRDGAEGPRPPMFLPFKLRGMDLTNRVVVSPMAQYCAVDGVPDDWHLVHYGHRALGGAGLVYTEMTCVSPEGRITPGCTGLWNETQRDAWRRIVEFVHRNSPTKICLQLGHSGRKGSTQLGWEKMDHPLPSDNWPIVAPSPVPYYEGISQPPIEMTRADMDKVRDDFVRATRFGLQAGFDMLELHMAHGYLLASYLSPLTNRRTDTYGGCIENRLRFPLEVLRTVRAQWPADKPLSVRISATDWMDGGLSDEDALTMVRAFRSAGIDLVDVSTGQTVPDQKPVYGRMWQTPFADKIRNELGIATMAVGNIYEPDHVNSIIASGRADLCAIARPHLANPAWTLEAAARQGYRPQWWPKQYLSGKTQLERNLQRAAQPGGPV